MKKLDLTIRQGSTWELPVMWELDRLIYKPILGASSMAPLRLMVTGHAAPDGWGVAVMNAVREINAKSNPPKDDEFLPTTSTSDDEIEFNKINAAGFRAITAGGHVVYYMPGDLSGCKARMQFKNKPGGTVIAPDLTTENNGIALDIARHRVKPRMTATQTAALSFRSAVYDLEIEDSAGTVYPLLHGTVSLTLEVTTIS